MTRIQKKYVFLTLAFLFVSAIIYIIVISYFSNNLNFKEYYTLTNTTKDIQHDKVSYICDNGKIFYVEKEKKSFHIETVAGDSFGKAILTLFEKEVLGDADTSDISWNYEVKEHPKGVSISLVDGQTGTNLHMD